METETKFKIEESPDDWGYVISDSQGIFRRVWAMPTEKKDHYDIYRLNKTIDLFGFGYNRVCINVPKSEVERKLIDLLENEITL